MVTPRNQVWNIISGLTADGEQTRRAPLRLWKGDEKTLHILSMLAAEMLATFRAAGAEPKDPDRTSVLYRLIAYLALRPHIRLTKPLRRDVALVATYIINNPAHLMSQVPFADLLEMARHAPRAPHTQDPEGPLWILTVLAEVLRAAVGATFAVSLAAFATVGFIILPQLITAPRAFGEASLEAWRTLLAAPPCGDDCRIPIPSRGGRP